MEIPPNVKAAMQATATPPRIAYAEVKLHSSTTAFLLISPPVKAPKGMRQVVSVEDKEYFDEFGPLLILFESFERGSADEHFEG